MKKIDLAFAVWCAVSIAFWCFYWFVSGTMVPFVVYYPLWLGGVGTFVWRDRLSIKSRLRHWAMPEPAKFLLLGFGAVLCEEVIAGLANHVPEGFSPALLLVRIGQYWAMNIFTFFGFIVGWYGLYRYVDFSRREVFWLAGGWGLYAEKVLFTIPSNPLFFVFDFSPTMLTYGLIIMPALWSQRATRDRRHWHKMLKYPLVYAVIFVLSLPAIMLLRLLRDGFPMLFPPASMVPL